MPVAVAVALPRWPFRGASTFHNRGFRTVDARLAMIGLARFRAIDMLIGTFIVADVDKASPHAATQCSAFYGGLGSTCTVTCGEYSAIPCKSKDGDGQARGSINGILYQTRKRRRLKPKARTGCEPPAAVNERQRRCFAGKCPFSSRHVHLFGTCVGPIRCRLGHVA